MTNTGRKLAIETKMNFAQATATMDTVDALTARVAELEAALRDMVESSQPPRLAAEGLVRAPSSKLLANARAVLAKS